MSTARMQQPPKAGPTRPGVLLAVLSKAGLSPVACIRDSLKVQVSAKCCSEGYRPPVAVSLAPPSRAKVLASLASLKVAPASSIEVLNTTAEKARPVYALPALGPGA